MALVGRALLVLALVICLYGIGASLYGARAHKQPWVDSGRRAMYALFGVIAVAFAILLSAFLRNDFSYNVVAPIERITASSLRREGGSGILTRLFPKNPFSTPSRATAACEPRVSVSFSPLTASRVEMSARPAAATAVGTRSEPNHPTIRSMRRL